MSTSPPAAPAAALPARTVTAARWYLMSLFALLGIMMSSWLSRLPSIRKSLGIAESELGVVLLVGAVGSLLMVTAAGPILQRFGSRRTMSAATVGFVTAMTLLAIGVGVSSLPLVCAGIFLNGMSFALNNVPFNVESAQIERAVGRTIIPQFHACFSIGALLGTLLGAAASWGGVSVPVQFGISAGVLLVWRLLAIPHVTLVEHVPARPEPTDGDVEFLRPRRRLGASLAGWREKRTLLLGLVIMAASLSEGAANDWLSISVVDDFGRTEATGAIVFGVFVGSMTVVRLGGTGLIDRYGRVPVLRVSGVTSIVGLALFGAAPSFVLAVVGVAMWGAGAALAYPIGIAAASDDPLKAPSRVSVVSAFSSTASIAAPPLLGFAAEHLTTRYALTLIVVGLVVSVLLSAQARRPEVRTPLAPLPGDTTAAREPATVVRAAEGESTELPASHADTSRDKEEVLLCPTP